ncbi:MAG: ABC transporter permease subunit, partial [Lachnospiraceae bacterium]|nr:ABC transporter permease subunit [Lachnospiraceae bacterium]
MTLSTMLSSMGEGMLRTCAIFFLTILFSMPLGMVIMFLRRSRFWLVREITKLYIAIMRGTPLMLQLLMWYFGPYYLFGMSIRGYRFPAIIIGFSMNYAAYFAEIYRGGIETIPKGQYEAAEVLADRLAELDVEAADGAVILRVGVRRIVEVEAVLEGVVRVAGAFLRKG